MSTSADNQKSALAIRDLSVVFDTDDGVAVTAVDHVSLDVRDGETLGLVGESGSGKSVTALSALRLVPRPPGRIVSGEVRFEEADLLAIPSSRLRRVRGAGIGMIFQEPMTALSPLHTIGRQLVEAQRLHADIPRREALAQAEAWLARVGIPDPADQLRAYPHQLSGGMRQRVMIAMTLMLKPRVIIADEPTTALDVTVQAQVFDLMRDMIQDATSLLLITHDMGVIWEMCSRVAVMYASEIVEVASASELFARPGHPYTEALLHTMPANQSPGARLPAIPGTVPSGAAYPGGCRFRDRCPYAIDACARAHPELDRVAGRRVRCILADQRLGETAAQATTATEGERHG